ncbi:MAG: hypothetical protein K2J88_03560, partial [Oscillospiraceae bacterium]|nr:hypothetical protein [Oscillospiraceae bacterium]
YNCSPIWVLNGDALIDVGLPEDLLQYQESARLLDEISTEYDSLFVNNEIEFAYKGFSSKEEEIAFDKKIRKAINLLKKVAGEKYMIQVDENI